MQSASPDFAQLKSNMKASWMAGDFGQIANFTVKAAEEFIERTQIMPGTRVLDVACGTGNTAIPAARAGGSVTGVDIAPSCLSRREGVRQQNNWKYAFKKGTLRSFRSAIMHSMLCWRCSGLCSRPVLNVQLTN